MGGLSSERKLCKLSLAKPYGQTQFASESTIFGEWALFGSIRCETSFASIQLDAKSMGMPALSCVALIQST